MKTQRIRNLIARSPALRRWDGWIMAALACYGLGCGLWLQRQGVNVTQEDGYYYFKIAQQMAHGAGSTFDGVHPTNGYHPLWLLCLAAVFRAVPTQERAVFGAVLVQSAWMAGCAALVYRAARTALRPASAALCAVVWIALTYKQALSGLEFGLHALCLLAAAALYLARFQSARPALGLYALLGAIMGLAFLARLETMLLAAILGVFLMLRERREGWSAVSIPRLLAYVLPIILPALLYFGINLGFFGHLMPVSAAVKQQWSAALLARDPLCRAHGWLAAQCVHLCWPLQDLKNHLAVASGVFLTPLVIALAAKRQRWPSSRESIEDERVPCGPAGATLRGRGLQPDEFAAPSRKEWPDIAGCLRGMRPFAVYSVGQFVLTSLLYYGDLSEKPWYYVVQPLLSALLAGALFQILAECCANRRPAAPALSAFSGALLLLAWWAVPLKTALTLRQWAALSRSGKDHPELRQAAYWIRANLPPEAVVGTWNAGTIGFLSGRRVINLDGLVNSWDYALVERKDLCAYFRKTRISYLVDAFENGKPLTRAEGFTDCLGCISPRERIWSDGRTGAAWQLEAYRLTPAGPDGRY